MFYYLLAVVVAVFDQGTKWAVIKYMELSESIPIIEGIFYLSSHRNPGAAFGILQNQRWFFIIITIIVVIGIVYYMRKTHYKNKGEMIAFSFILGGAAGNFIDRVFRAEVVDMLDFRLINYPIFNVADSFIVMGVIIFILYTLMDLKG